MLFDICSYWRALFADLNEETKPQYGFTGVYVNVVIDVLLSNI
jgi:hypothetical protein